MVIYYIAAALFFLSIQRLLELRLAARNQAWSLSQGAEEFGAKHYPLFFVLHIGWIIGWIWEGLLKNDLSDIWAVWLGIFIAAQFLRYWAITSLGKFWNTRILIVPNATPVTSGAYKFLNHPNYIAVVLELLSLPMIFNAWKTAVIATVLNAALLLFIRIPAENRALQTMKSH
ncbi:MAG: isoprenylcysteine carboxylmethyltransferase family protein [Bacteroidota bacterium]